MLPELGRLCHLGSFAANQSKPSHVLRPDVFRDAVPDVDVVVRVRDLLRLGCRFLLNGRHRRSGFVLSDGLLVFAFFNGHPGVGLASASVPFGRVGEVVDGDVPSRGAQIAAGLCLYANGHFRSDEVKLNDTRNEFRTV